MINHEHYHHKNYDNLWKNEDLFEIIKVSYNNLEFNFG